MSDLASWQGDNELYLAAAMKWLRRLLKLHIFHQQIPVTQHTVPAEPEQHPPAKRGLFRRPPVMPSQATPIHLLPPASITLEMVEDAAKKMNEIAQRMQPPPSLLILGKRFGLSRFDRDVLLLCAGVEMDTRIAALCGMAQGDTNANYPTFALAMALFDDPAWDTRSPRQPLRYWEMLEINQPRSSALNASPLRADERIVNYIKGLNYLDDRLTPLVVQMEVGEASSELPPSQQSAVDRITRHLSEASEMASPPAIQLLGPDGPSKQLVVRGVAEALGLVVYRLPAKLLPAQTADLETFARLWERESMLVPIALYVEAREDDSRDENAARAPGLDQLLARSNGFFFLDAHERLTELGRPSVTLDISKPTAAEQQAGWAAALGDQAPESPALLAAQFDLNLTAINQIAAAEVANVAGDPRPLDERLWDACLISTRPHLEALAQKIEAKAEWENIVLPKTEVETLKQIAQQVRQRGKVYEEWGFRDRMNRGLGISALFAGDSGTGKTMAAEVIANELRLNLYRIDLSAVISKYIGQTEKNLRRLFDAAENGGAILFFDEADAIFGKRSEVKDSHDRYANIEINYLLQRMESYRGLAILATNMKSALDTAFLRRLRFVVDFPFPSAEERKQIWEKVFPARTPTEGLDLDRLKKHELTGGSIQNIALNAAFMAAHAGAAVTMPILFDAIKAEMRKIGRPINEADFRLKEQERATV
jgi:hypothetical protein